MRILFYLAVLSSLVACSTLPPVAPYTEPSPSQDTARLRVVVQQGLQIVTMVYPDKPGLCFDGKSTDGQQLPVHSNTTIWKPEAKKKIGMPFVDEYSKLYGAEFYVSSKLPIMLTNSIVKQTSYSISSCFIGFKNQFEAGKDYQVTIKLNDKTCTSELTDITNFNPAENLKVIPTIPLINPRSPLWKSLCETTKEAN